MRRFPSGPKCSFVAWSFQAKCSAVINYESKISNVWAILFMFQACTVFSKMHCSSVKCITCYILSPCNKCVDLVCDVLISAGEAFYCQCDGRCGANRDKFCVVHMPLHVLTLLQRFVAWFLLFYTNEELLASRGIRLYMNIKANFIRPWVLVSWIPPAIDNIHFLGKILCSQIWMEEARHNQIRRKLR